MGRPYTGADTTARAPRLELPCLMKAGYFTKDAEVKGTWRWSNGDHAEIFTKHTPTSAYMDIVTHFEDHAGTMQEARQHVDLCRKPSNLGRGEVLYFRCPWTFTKCRILYRAYHSHNWRSRKGFHRRVLYPSQRMSGWTRHNQRESQVEAKLERLYSMRGTFTYQGTPTRRALRIAELEEQAERLAVLGWHPMLMPVSIRRALEQGVDLGIPWGPFA